jgi:hypothetical protein
MESLFWLTGGVLGLLAMCEGVNSNCKGTAPVAPQVPKAIEFKEPQEPQSCEKQWENQLVDILTPTQTDVDITHRPLLTTHAPPIGLPKTQAIPVPQPGLEAIPTSPEPNCSPNVRFNPAKPLIVNDVHAWSFIPTGDLLASRVNLTSAPNLYNDQVPASNVAAQNNPKRWNAFNDVEWTPTRVDQYTEYLPYDAPCEVGKKDPKFWRGDLNPAINQRNMLIGAQWNFYNHLKAKQLWMQYLAKDMDSRRDPYTRLIRRPHQQECPQIDKDETFPDPPKE